MIMPPNRQSPLVLLSTPRRKPTTISRRSVLSKFRRPKCVLPVRRGPWIRYNPFVFSPHPNPIPSINDEKKEADSSSSDNYNGEGIEKNVTIFRQLSILKLGGYWKHLQREDQWEGITPQQSWIFGGNDENKENVIRSHPNIFTTVPVYHEQRDITIDDDIAEEDDDGDDGDDIEEVDDFCLNGRKSDLFIECAFNTDRVGFVGGGFYIQKITGDGWICSDQLYDKNNINDDDGQQDTQTHQLSTLPLLRLPKKVTALGQEGMYIEDIDLMKRRDNGTIEPCNHRHNSHYDTIFCSTSEDICRRISF